MSTELATIGIDELYQTARLLASSGYFDARGTADQAVAQIATKILAGREMGYGPFASVNGINIIQGKPTVSANLMAAAVKASGKYDYRVRTMTDLEVSIEFFAVGAGKREPLGVSTFTAEDAKKAGTQNVNKFPRNMLFARAISNGVRWYCPDVFLSGAVYTPEEFDGSGDVEVVDAAIAPPVVVPIDQVPDQTRFKRMHALGRETFGDAWRNGEGREVVKSLTGKESTKELTGEEVETVITALEAWEDAPSVHE